MKVELDLFNCDKSRFKNSKGVYAAKFTKKGDLACWKSEIDK